MKRKAAQSITEMCFICGTVALIGIAGIAIFSGGLCNLFKNNNVVAFSKDRAHKVEYIYDYKSSVALTKNTPIEDILCAMNSASLTAENTFGGVNEITLTLQVMQKYIEQLEELLQEFPESLAFLDNLSEKIKLYIAQDGQIVGNTYKYTLPNGESIDIPIATYNENQDLYESVLKKVGLLDLTTDFAAGGEAATSFKDQLDYAISQISDPYSKNLVKLLGDDFLSFGTSLEYKVDSRQIDTSSYKSDLAKALDDFESLSGVLPRTRRLEVEELISLIDFEHTENIRPLIDKLDLYINEYTINQIFDDSTYIKSNGDVKAGNYIVDLHTDGFGKGGKLRIVQGVFYVGSNNSLGTKITKNDALSTDDYSVYTYEGDYYNKDATITLTMANNVTDGQVPLVIESSIGNDDSSGTIDMMTGSQTNSDSLSSKGGGDVRIDSYTAQLFELSNTFKELDAMDMTSNEFIMSNLIKDLESGNIEGLDKVNEYIEVYQEGTVSDIAPNTYNNEALCNALAKEGITCQ